MEEQTNKMDDATRNSLIERVGDPTEYRVRRRDDANLDLRDIVFRGWKLGDGEDGTGGDNIAFAWTRGVVAAIYLSEGGNLITSIARWTRYDGEYGHLLADTHTDANDAYEWFMNSLMDAQSEQYVREAMWDKRNVALWNTPEYRAREDQCRAMSVAIKEAWDNACSVHPALESAGVEVIA